MLSSSHTPRGIAWDPSSDKELPVEDASVSGPWHWTWQCCVASGSGSYCLNKQNQPPISALLLLPCRPARTVRVQGLSRTSLMPMSLLFIFGKNFQSCVRYLVAPMLGQALGWVLGSHRGPSPVGDSHSAAGSGLKQRPWGHQCRVGESQPWPSPGCFVN